MFHILAVVFVYVHWDVICLCSHQSEFDICSSQSWCKLGMCWRMPGVGVTGRHFFIALRKAFRPPVWT